MCLLVYSKENPERQMTLLILVNKYLQIGMFDVQNTITTLPLLLQNVSQLKTNVQIIFDLGFTPLNTFNSLYRFFPS